jgi:hypothetical protein
MSYSAEISRDNPTCILFVIDQSGSMDEKMGIGKSKADFVADVLNKTIYTLVTNCTKSDGVRNYFDVGVITYGGSDIRSGLGKRSGAAINSIVELANHPVRVEDRVRTEDDGAGGILERRVKFPVWFDATSSGGTPMCAGLTAAAEAIAEWCDAHPNSYPPTIIHVTDGASTDGDPEHVGDALRRLATNDGASLVFNIHVSAEQGEPVSFPASESALPDSYARMLFRISSAMPPHVAEIAADKGYSLADGARGYMFNADPRGIANFFEIGTRPRLTSDR